jgi:hypothetical protein
MRDLFALKYEEPPGPVDPRIGPSLTQLRDSPDQYLQRYADNDSPLPLNGFVCVLALFNFCWSRESADQFSQCISSSQPRIVRKLCECLLVHPLTHVYFRSALTAVFEALPGKSGAEAKTLILEALADNSPLLPPFIRRLLLADGGCGKLFYECFLKRVLDYPFLFGIAHPEMKLYIEKEISAVTVELDTFFASDDGSNFVTSRMTADPSNVSIEPSEADLCRVSPDYEPATWVDSYCLREISKEIKIGESHVLFVKLKPRELPPAAVKEPEDIVCIASRFLVNAALVSIGAEKRTPVEYFEALAALSSPFGDTNLQKDLDALTDALEKKPMAMAELIAGIEQRCVELSRHDPLEEIAEYSPRSAYITKLSKFVQEIQTNALEWLEYSSVLDIALEASPPDREMTPAKFITYFETIHKTMVERLTYPFTFSANRSLFSILLLRTSMLDQLRARADLAQGDADLMQFLRDRKAELLAGEQMSFLEPYNQNPEKMNLFLMHYRIAFETEWPLTRLQHLHMAYQILVGLLQLQGMAEIGGDQIVPFAVMGTVYAAPRQLLTTQTILKELLEPLIDKMSPLDHSMEYSVTQFLSACQYVITRMREMSAK